MKTPKMPEMPEVKKTRMPSTNDAELEEAARRRKQAALKRQGQLSTMLSDNIRNKDKLGSSKSDNKKAATVVSQNTQKTSSGTKLGA